MANEKEEEVVEIESKAIPVLHCKNCGKEVLDGRLGHINYCSYECYCDD